MASALAHPDPVFPLTSAATDARAAAANDPSRPAVCVRHEQPGSSMGRGDAGCLDGASLLVAPAPALVHALGNADASTNAASNAKARATLPNGSTYPGELIGDILEYRSLRARTLLGGHLDPEPQARYERLDELLCSGDAEGDYGHGRAYRRFDLRMPGKLRVREGRGTTTMDIGIDNVSAGGVKLFGGRARAAGERVELLVERGEKRTVILPARIAWMRGDAVGLMFAGAARFR